MHKAQHMRTGTDGEIQAAAYLEKQGYCILARNWRYRRCEVDIIAGRGDEVVFVEVKTRSNTDFGEPELAVTRAKQQLMAKAAWAFMENIKPGFTPRFDVVAILVQGDDKGLLHFEDAFFPNWLY